MGNIKVLKLSNGDEIVGEVDPLASTGEFIVIDQPLRVFLTRGQDGQPGKSLIDWLMLKPEARRVPVYKTQLAAAPMDPPKDVEDAWREQTSGIILATQLNG